MYKYNRTHINRYLIINGPKFCIIDLFINIACIVGKGEKGDWSTPTYTPSQSTPIGKCF